MGYKKRTDANHVKISGVLTKLGLFVIDLSSVGKGVPDLLVRTRRGLHFVEVKTEKGKLNQLQREFIERSGCSVTVVRTVDEAVAFVQGIDKLNKGV